MANDQVSIDAFFMENVADTNDTKEVKFARFNAPFVVVAVSAERAGQLKKLATRRLRNKAGISTQETDQDRYVDLLIVESLKSPNPNNAKLQENWGTPGDAVATLKRMLKVGEYADLANAVQEVSGFDLDDEPDELREQVKN